MKWMNLHHLKYFLVIAEEGSIAAASKKLLVGQPALSAQLKQFEDWLGTKLFNRDNKRLVLNEAGEYVLRYAKAIKELEDELVTNMESGYTAKARELTVGAQESVPKSMLAGAISALGKGQTFQVRVIEGTGSELFELLLAGKIDVFIGNFRPLADGKEMIYTSLGKESVSVWGPKSEAKLKENFPRSLEGQSFILPGFQNPLRHDFDRFMLEAGLSFNVAVEAQDTALQKELVSRGVGLMVFGDESAKAWAKTGRIVRLGGLKDIKEEYWIGMVKRAIDNKHLKEILASI
jgi:LysR family transcriptional activator of nhaA